jgi:flagella basal body P-ring formation protein FlgA
MVNTTQTMSTISAMSPMSMISMMSTPITLSIGVLCLVASGAFAAPGSSRSASCDHAHVEDVIKARVSALVDTDAVLTIDVMDCEVTTNASIDAAIAEPGGRFGKPMRWRLMEGRQPRGWATVVVSGDVAHVRAVRAITSGAVLQASDVEITRSELSDMPLERLPALDAVVGARVLRDVVKDEVITVRVARIPPAVRSGDRVVVQSTVGRVQVTGVATAQQSGEVGDVIRLLNPESRHTLRARVTGRGAVEVINE